MDGLQLSHVIIFGMLAYLVSDKANKCAASLLMLSGIFYLIMIPTVWTWLKAYPDFFWVYLIKLSFDGWITLRLLRIDTVFSNIVAFILFCFVGLHSVTAIEYPFLTLLENIHPSCNIANTCYGLIRPEYAGVSDFLNTLILIVGGIYLGYVVFILFNNNRVFDRLVNNKHSNFITFISIFKVYKKGKAPCQK